MRALVIDRGTGRPAAACCSACTRPRAISLTACARHHRVARSRRAVLVRAPQRERRREAARIRERIERREVRVEHRRREPVVGRELRVDATVNWSCSNSRGHHVALADERVAAAQRSPWSPGRCRRRADPARGAGMTKSPVTRIAQVEELRARRPRCSRVGGARALRLRDRRAGCPGSAREKARQQVLLRAWPSIRRSAAGRTVMLLAVGTKPVSAVVRW